MTPTDTADAADAEQTWLGEIVDLARYPIGRPGTAEYSTLVADARETLRQTNCVQLHGFLRPTAIASMCAEVESKSALFDGHKDFSNVYFSPDDPSLPKDHPVRIMQPTSGRLLCRDRMDPDGLMVRLFGSDSLLCFVRDVMGKAVLYRHADPMKSLLTIAARDGEDGLWHFDSNEVTVTILLQKPRGGGKFEYVPNLRSDDDQNFEGVGAILRGSRQGVISMEAEAGSLQLFNGRHALHHVSAAEGPVERLILVLGYADQPGVQSSKQSVDLQGRDHPLHEESAGRTSL